MLNCILSCPSVYNHFFSMVTCCDFKSTFIGHMIAPLNLQFPTSMLCLVCFDNRVVTTLRIVCPVRFKGKKILFEVQE